MKKSYLAHMRCGIFRNAYKRANAQFCTELFQVMNQRITMNRIKIFLIVLLISTSAYSQVIGGRENSESAPKVAEATQLSGGGFVGDVNVMTGEFQASIPLGSVSTTAGLGFSLIRCVLIFISGALK